MGRVNGSQTIKELFFNYYPKTVAFFDILCYNFIVEPLQGESAMKQIKIIAALLSLSLILTGCGGDFPTETNSSESASVEITETEPLNTETQTTTANASNTATEAPKTQPKAEVQNEHREEKTTEVPISQSNDQQSFHTEDQSRERKATTTTISEITTTAMTITTSMTTQAETTTTTNRNPLPKVVLDGMTLEQKVAQMFMVTPEALTGITPMTQVGNGTQKAIEEIPVGGIILFAQNLTSRDQTKQMLAATQGYAKSACGIGLFTAVDEEGGLVARCAQKLGTAKFDDMASYGKDNNSDTALNIGCSIGRDLKSLGFNVDFAPVADVNICSSNELGNRIFSDDPQVVANMSSYVAKGLRNEGVCATLKHFPGLGAANGNTHTNSTVVIDRTLEQLREAEFIPFSEGIKTGVDFIMVGHQSVTGFGDNLPCDLSYKAVTEVLRGELGFTGIAITDSQRMNTIANVYNSGEAAKLSIKAGIDIILMPVDYRQAVNEVCAAVRSGEISEERINESVMRILRKKYALGLLKK